MKFFKSKYRQNTLQYFPKKCIGCGRCTEVCPHRIFSLKGKKAVMNQQEKCMECGACMKNCPTKAIIVKAGVGCAGAMFYAAITGNEPTCGCKDGKGGCC